MSARIRHHIRSNVIGYLALFVALGGTAYATHPGGANTISSGDIIDNVVRSEDLRDGNVTSADLRTDSVLSGKIADGAVQSADVANNSLAGIDVADNSLTGDDIADDAISPAELDEMPAARVSGKPTFTGDGQPTGFTTASTETPCGSSDTRLFNDQEDSIEWWASTAVDFDTQGLAVNECAGTGFIDEYKYLRAPIAGTYLVVGHLDWDANASGTRQLRLEARDQNDQNPQDFAATQTDAVSESGKWTRQEVSGITRLGVDDRVRLHARVTGAGSGNHVLIRDADLAMTWLNP